MRKARGFTQDELAAMIERSTEALSNIERGVSIPAIDTLERLSYALGVQVQDFFANQDTSKGTSLHVQLMAQLLAIAGHLSDKQLALAVAQVRAIKDGG